MNYSEARVHVVDGDCETNYEFCGWLESAGLPFTSHRCGESFLREFQPDTPGCVVSELHLSDLSGLELMRTTALDAPDLPFVIVTAYASVSLAVQAMKAGAFSFDEKPLSEHRLLQSVRAALDASLSQHQERTTREAALKRLDKLSRRERQVLDLLAAFQPPKQIAKRLQLSVRTIDYHRANLLEKMEMDSVSELIYFYLSSGLAQQQSQAEAMYPVGV
ncbi:MAG TPA: LuxR C-terminal-related transcriptional regulator [Pirellulales bacterium]|nr:LuxR C-terminal-related transcriptional regulator [Pirellulales bacterium]